MCDIQIIYGVLCDGEKIMKKYNIEIKNIYEFWDFSKVLCGEYVCFPNDTYKQYKKKLHISKFINNKYFKVCSYILKKHNIDNPYVFIYGVVLGDANKSFIIDEKLKSTLDLYYVRGLTLDGFEKPVMWIYDSYIE